MSKDVATQVFEELGIEDNRLLNNWTLAKKTIELSRSKGVIPDGPLFIPMSNGPTT